MDVANWLNQLGLEHYQNAFAAHGVDAEVLQELTVEDLKEMGVSVLGHRRKLLTAMEGLRRESSRVAPRTAGEQLTNDAIVLPERRHLTVLFSDVVGSTVLSARLDPEDLRDIIRNFHAAVADIVREQGGFVAQYLGD